MLLTTLFVALVLFGTFAVGVLCAWLVLRLFVGRRARTSTETRTIAERVRSVGKLVGLEVFAKEIATARSGWSWCPPILLSQAKLAMIFHFEKQYSVDLAAVRGADVVQLAPDRYRVHLPPIEGSLRLVDVTPYDIQQGRMLGLLEVISMNADRQAQLMRDAQQQASRLYDLHEDKYTNQARETIERHLAALLGLFNVQVEWVWHEEAQPGPAPDAPRREPLKPVLALSA